LKNNNKGENHSNMDLETLIKNLDNGFYISRILIRNAFSLYLYKIQLRLLNESKIEHENNSDTINNNSQQMDLVLRFIRKAAPNLSTSKEFKTFVPSKRLPLNEQKRMLAKQLHDFLHIYRKDTEQIRSEMSSQLEDERKKNTNMIIDELGFKNLLHKCNEIQLEEIMSVYMKNTQDSSVFLGGPDGGGGGSQAKKKPSNLIYSINQDDFNILKVFFSLYFINL
jgi:tubulin polyglutamylase TTLL5